MCTLIHRNLYIQVVPRGLDNSNILSYDNKDYIKVLVLPLLCFF